MATETNVQNSADETVTKNEVSSITDDSVSSLQALATEATNAEDNYKSAYRTILEQLYLFDAAHGKKAIIAYLQDRGLKVTARGNSFTAVCKLAFANRRDGAWVVTDANNSQINRYSTVLADFKKAATSQTLLEWIGDRTLTQCVNDARAADELEGDTEGDENDKTANGNNGSGKGNRAKLSPEQIRALAAPFGQKVKEALPGAPKIILDLAKAGIDPGPATILCEVDKNGNATLLGVAQATDTIVKSILKEKKNKKTVEPEKKGTTGKKLTLTAFKNASEEDKVAMAEFLAQRKAASAKAA